MLQNIPVTSDHFNAPLLNKSMNKSNKMIEKLQVTITRNKAAIVKIKM